MQDSVAHVGHIVSKNGIQKSLKKVKAIFEMLHPKHQKEYFMPNLSDICKPLNALLQKTAKWRWRIECKETFFKIKDKQG